MLIGHERLVDDFTRLAEANALSHSYLFLGPPRVGKKSFALYLAHCVEHGTFDDAKALRETLLVAPDEERTIGIDAIRGVKHFLLQKPVASSRRIAIIDDAEKMTGDAQNALLKIAEEPPASSLLILASGDSEKLWYTLRSRLQQIYFAPVPSREISRWLKENLDCKKEEAEAAAISSFGQPGLAWRVLRDEQFKSRLREASVFLQSRFWERRNLVKSLLERDDFDLGEFLETLLISLSKTAARDGSRFALWHKILELRRNADFLNLNPRLQLENLMGDS